MKTPTRLTDCKTPALQEAWIWVALQAGKTLSDAELWLAGVDRPQERIAALRKQGHAIESLTKSVTDAADQVHEDLAWRRVAPPPSGGRRAACVVIRDSRGLVLQVSRRHEPTAWGLPGGKVDPGETDSQAAVREVLEETGLVIEPQALTLVYEALLPGSVDYWVSAFEYQGRGAPLQALRAEAGLQLRYESFEALCDAEVSPFSRYNQGVRAALRRPGKESA